MPLGLKRATSPWKTRPAEHVTFTYSTSVRNRVKRANDSMSIVLRAPRNLKAIPLQLQLLHVQ
eukprot:2985210-Amphidinium_carterae.1